MIIRTQESLYFTGLSIIYCTMETLGKVFGNSLDSSENKNGKVDVFFTFSALEFIIFVLHDLSRILGNLN